MKMNLKALEVKSFVTKTNSKPHQTPVHIGGQRLLHTLTLPCHTSPLICDSLPEFCRSVVDPCG